MISITISKGNTSTDSSFFLFYSSPNFLNLFFPRVFLVNSMNRIVNVRKYSSETCVTSSGINYHSFPLDSSFLHFQESDCDLRSSSSCESLLSLNTEKILVCYQKYNVYRTNLTRLLNCLELHN